MSYDQKHSSSYDNTFKTHSLFSAGLIGYKRERSLIWFAFLFPNNPQ